MCRKYSSFVKGNFWNLYFYSLLLHMYQALKFQISWYWIVDYVLNRFREPMLKIGSVSSLVLSPAPSGKLLPRFFIRPWEEQSTYLMYISTTCLMQAFFNTSVNSIWRRLMLIFFWLSQAWPFTLKIQE